MSVFNSYDKQLSQKYLVSHASFHIKSVVFQSSEPVHVLNFAHPL